MAGVEQDDLYDYTMSDLFISETRPRPYRIGFHRCRPPRRPSLASINALGDREFTAYCRNGCQLPTAGLSVQAELDELRSELQALRAEIRALGSARSRTAPTNSAFQGGLNVPPRP